MVNEKITSEWQVLHLGGELQGSTTTPKDECEKENSQTLKTPREKGGGGYIIIPNAFQRKGKGIREQAVCKESSLNSHCVVSGNAGKQLRFSSWWVKGAAHNIMRLWN